MSAPHADRDHSEQPTHPEAFVELLPPNVGHNLRHLGPERAHVTGEECHCSPERIPHPTQGTPRSVSAREVRASEAQVEAAMRASNDHADARSFWKYARSIADAVVAAGDADEVASLRRRVADLQDEYRKAGESWDRTRERLRAEAERWTEKAQEAGAAYANANSKHHAELDRANRLERLANTLAERAVDLEDRARAAEAERGRLAEVVARVEALADEWAQEVPSEWARVHLDVERAIAAAQHAIVDDLRAALSAPEPAPTTPQPAQDRSGAPQSVSGQSGTGGALGGADYPALTFDEFEYGAGYTYRGVPIVEDENAVCVFAWGHIEPARFVRVVHDYDVEMAGEAERYELSDVRHVWAITEAPSDSPDGWRIKWGGITEDTPGAFAVTVVNR